VENQLTEVRGTQRLILEKMSDLFNLLSNRCVIHNPCQTAPFDSTSHLLPPSLGTYLPSAEHHSDSELMPVGKGKFKLWHAITIIYPSSPDLNQSQLLTPPIAQVPHCQNDKGGYGLPGPWGGSSEGAFVRASWVNFVTIILQPNRRYCAN
jgi:hypothetical protein